MKVRKALPKDLAFIVQSQLDMALETENLQLDQGVLLKGVRAVFDDPSKGHYWIVDKDANEQTPMGMCLTVPEWSDWRNGVVLWIHSVYTLPQFRSFGVYRTLYTFLQDMVLKSPALCGLRLYVDKRNSGAQKVYEKMGMNAEHYTLYEWLK